MCDGLRDKQCYLETSNAYAQAMSVPTSTFRKKCIAEGEHRGYELVDYESVE